MKLILIVSSICVIFTLHAAPFKEDNSAVNNTDFAISTVDVNRFQALMDIWQDKSTAEQISLLEDHYLSDGSKGLDDFCRIKIRDKQKFIDTVNGLFSYYQSLDFFSFSTLDLRPQLTKMFSCFSQWTESAHPLDVYFVVGRLSSAGTVRQTGILIGAEHFAYDEPHVLTEKGYKFSLLDELLAVIAHEYTHSFQHQAGPATLVRAAIFEGGADFLAEISTGISPANKEAYHYGLSHEKQVWDKFKAQMYSTDVSQWIANRKKADWPADMGYYMGYQIAKAFYNNMDDKKAAFEHLTHVTDPEYILYMSQYETTFD